MVDDRGVLYGRRPGLRDGSPRVHGLETSPWFRYLPAFGMIAANLNLHRLMGVSTQSAGLLEGDVHRALVMGGAYALVAVLLLRRLAFALERVRGEWLYMLLLVYMLSSMFWSEHPLKVLTGFAHSLGVWMIGLATAYWTAGSVRRLAEMLVWPLALLLLISVVLAVAWPTIGIDMKSGYQRWMGITYHPNSLGLVSLIVTWSALTCLHFEPKLRTRLLLWASIAIAGLCLVKSNSMTSTLVSASMLAVYLWTALVKRTNSTPVSALIFLCFGLAGLGALVFVKPELLTYEGFLHAIGRSATLTGRVELWDLALQMHAERPLLGWSFDALASVPARFGLGYGQLHSGFFDLLVRGGDVGLFLVVLVVIQAVLRLLAVYRRSPVEGSWGLGLLLASVLHNVTEASLARAPHPMWLAFSMLLLTAASTTGAPSSVAVTGTAGASTRVRPRYANIVGADAPTADRQAV